MTWFKPDLPLAPKLWWVCFVGMKKLTPWDWLLSPGYRHAFLLGYLPDAQMWLRYEVLFHRTEISLVSGDIAGRLLSLAMTEGGVLSWPAGEWQRPTWGLRFGLWCVPAIKHVLGVRCVALTPEALHDWLLRNGGKPLVTEENHEPVQLAEGPAGRPGGESRA